MKELCFKIIFTHQVLFGRIMILKSPPQVFFTGGVLTSAIGSPEDYIKNKSSGNFPESTDIRIKVTNSTDITTDDLANMMEQKARVSNRKEDQQDEKRRENDQRQNQRPHEVPQAENDYGASMKDQHMPIKALNQFNSDWCIKARILKKAPMKNYTNAKGQGCILNVDLIDREGTMIQATAFNETAKKIDEQIQQNEVYTFAGGQIKIANKKFTAIKNDYCITFGYETVIEKVQEDRQITTSAFSFTGLKDIEEIIQQCTIDVIGVVLEVNPVSQIQTKDGRSLDKRDLMIGDESNVSIKVTLWGDACESKNYEMGQVIAFQNCRVSDYNGKSLNGSSNPQDITESSTHKRFAQLKNWVGGKKSLEAAKGEMKALSQNRGGG